MASASYDIITVGGGLGGAVLGKVMAEHGARVLVLERESTFKDRVRGEGMHPWGVPEARALGIYELLRDTCGHESRWWDTYMGSELINRRDFVATTPHRSPLLGFSHPEMQELLLGAAEDAGAEVRRGVRVRHVSPGSTPSVVVEQHGRVEELRARLAVGADGRYSIVRKAAVFAVKQDPARRMFAGVLCENVPVSPDAWYEAVNPDMGETAFLCPIGRGRVRAYFGFPKDTQRRFQGQADFPRFVEAALGTGASIELYAGARPIGPLATFEADDTWVEHPYRAGVALIGDAAATPDPTIGQGLSMTLRDVHVLRDQLLAHDNWDTAGHAYAEQHDQGFAVIHAVETWMKDILLETGPEAEARRAKALPLLSQDETRMPDLFGLGPAVPVGDTVRRRFYGEE